MIESWPGFERDSIDKSKDVHGVYPKMLINFTHAYMIASYIASHILVQLAEISYV